MNKNNVLNLALRQVSRKLSVDIRVVENVYRSYWMFVKDYITHLPLKTMSEEEFNSTVTNFNLPYIGKLYTNYDKVIKYKNQLKFYQDVKAKKNQADRLSGTGD